MVRYYVQNLMMIIVKTFSFSLFQVLLCATFTYAQNVFPIKNNRLHGEYSNSQKNLTISGSFENNLRKDVWTVTDSSGNVIYSRNYTSPYTYIEKRQQNNTVSSTQGIAIERDSSGLYVYPSINFKNVLWSKRVWAILPAQQVPELHDTRLMDYITKWVKNKKLTAYHDDQLSTVVNEKDFDLSDKSIKGVTIKKDYYYDDSLCMMLEKLICLTFYLTDKSGLESSFSLHYASNTRELLQLFPVENKNERIENIDDLIFFNDLESVIYRTGAPNQKDIKPDFSQTKQYTSLSKEVLMVILETEHNYWFKEM